MQSETKYTKQDLETMRAWSLQRKIQVTQTRIIEWIGRYDWNVYISFSGGKDSTVLADLTARAYQAFTFDNGTEFAAAEELERSCVNKRLPRTKVYFCHPYSSWERGTNENTNGMIRRRFPKGTNFAAVTNAQIAQAENWINNYPRKILGYKSSEIVFRECLRELGIAA